MECEVIGNDCYCITWTIQNFSYCWQNVGEALTCPQVYFNAREETKWKLLLFPRGIYKNDYTIVCLSRKGIGKAAEKKEVKYSFEFIDNNGSILTFCEGKYEYHKGFAKAIILTKLLKHLPQDILILRCRITFTGETIEIKQLFVRTIINVESMSFLWSIENFSSLSPDEIKTFVIKSASEEVVIEINFFLTEEKFSEADIFLNIRLTNQCLKYSTVKTFILDSEKKKISAGVSECWCEDEKLSTFPLKFTKNDLMNSKNHFLPNDVLTLSFELNVSSGQDLEGIEKVVSVYTPQTSNEEIKSWRDYNTTKKISDSPSALVSDLMSLYDDQSLCDMKLQTKTNVFPVHTSILGARSPVFRAMFSNEMKEKVRRCIDVSDIDDETVRRLLLYIYTDKLESLNWDDALQLFKAADKYTVVPLKERCSTFLKDHLHLENACEVLILSDLHQDEDLKVLAQNFILKNAKKVLKTEEWKILADSYSKLALETMSRNWIED